MSVKIFSFIFLKTVVTILKLLKSIYNDVSKTKKKLFLFFGGLLYANTHYNKTRTQKKYIYIYINNVTLRIWLPIQQQLFFQCHNSRCWDGKNVSSYELLWRTRIYSCNVGSMINILLTYLYFLKRIWPGKEMYRYFTRYIFFILFWLLVIVEVLHTRGLSSLVNITNLGFNYLSLAETTQIWIVTVT